MSTQAEISAFFERLCKAWETNDAAEVGGLFADDGTLINPFGQRADGRDAVTAMYGEYFAGMLGGTSTTVEVQSVRTIDATHSLVDAEQAILGPDGSTVLDVHLTALLRQEGGEWRLVDTRPFSYQEPRS
jgi:uncharacterized protein (TIGR02246 family)